MNGKTFRSSLARSHIAACLMALASGGALAQQAVNLTAAPGTLTMPDGAAVPMWGYTCGGAVSGSTATCASLNKGAASGSWSPVLITVPTGQTLQISLTNNLSFANANSVPTSLTIVGQLGGGLGDPTQRTTTAAPDHSSAQANVTWPIAGAAGTPGTPPQQGPRVQSFATEVAAGATTTLTWTTPRPGTYLIESGTHPSIQGAMGLYGILVVTAAPAVDATGKESAAGTAYPGVSYDAEVALLLSEVDPVQNAAVSAAVNTSGFSESAVWSGQPGGCGNPASASYRTCYPPVVNYTPTYYLINGVGFSRTSAARSLFAAAPQLLAPAAGPGAVLVRFVNAGLHMHVPAIVGSQVNSGGATPSGFALIAEDGNPLPGTPRVQSEVFMAAGKTYDVMINAPAALAPATTPPALAVFDRELSLSGNATTRDAGMLAYIGTNSATLPASLASVTSVVRPDAYNSLLAGQALVVADPARGVMANDTNVNGVTLTTPASHGTVTLNANGTFSYVPTGASALADSFGYCAYGSTSLCTTVTLGLAPTEGAAGISVQNDSYLATVASALSVKSPGVLANDSDGAGYPLSIAPGSYVAGAVNPGTLSVALDPSGAFNATASAPGTYTFSYKARNSQGTVSATAATVTLVFPAASGLVVKVVDGADKVTPITDYRWIIEEDRTFYVDPNCTSNPVPATCPTYANGTVPTFGTNFHTSYMPVVATGCTGALSCESGQSIAGNAVVCDLGDGVCEAGTQQVAVDPGQVHLDPSKRYYISVLPGDAATPFINGNLTGNCLNGAANASNAAKQPCGHGMGGAPIAAGQLAATILTQPTPFPPAKLSVFVFEDDWPLNGEVDTGGGVDVLSPQEPGLGSFNITIMDDAGGPGDATGQVNYDMFNQPLSNSLAGTLDPATKLDACPISKIQRNASNDPTQTGITGTIVTCPKYESDGMTLSPLAGQAVLANMMPGRYGVIATPAADRIARGEEWLQTNTLDGQKAHDSFLRVGESSYFQEFGPAGYHVSIGFANPKIINARLAGVCAGSDVNVTLPALNCNNTLTGKVTTERMSRTPDERLYSSESRASFAFTQCYVSVGDPDGEDFAFSKCNADGTFSISGLPDGDWRITTFDQWNDQLVDGLSTPVRLSAGTTASTTNVGDIAANQWQANFMTRTFIDSNRDGISQASEPGLTFAKTNVRFRDGSFSNRNNTDLNGFAAFNEEFPLFNWYVIETDATRYKNTGTHVVYDAGGPADNTGACNGTAPCGGSAIADHLANTLEQVSLPTSLRVPGAVYCKDADCSTHASGIAGGPASSDPPSACTTDSSGKVSCTTTLSTGRIDPPWVLTEGWQGFSGQNNILEFGKVPYAAGENGGIRGHVVYSSTRPFDDPQFGTQNVWEPLVPNVTINLYLESTAPDGSTALKLVDTTRTTSFDDWAQGFRSDGNPNMSCPGQATSDPFYFSLNNQPDWLDAYNAQHNGTTAHTVPYNSQFKCYDGMHNWNQLQPAPYDGMYQFPSVTGLDPVTGKPTGTNCTACIADPDTADPYRYGTPMLKAGKYVVEVVVPPGYELVKEEDKNILIGDNFIAPVTVQFPGLGTAIYIVPDQAEVSASYNANSAQNATNSLGRIQSLPSHEGDTPTEDAFWPCVGATRTVPDFISLFPQSKEVAPFAGATRNLCDRKEVTLTDEVSAQAEFFVFTSTHAAAHFAGVITDDFTSEFDPFSPQFGEKFAPPDLPVSIKDWAGNEISRVYADHWGAYNGLTYSTWEVNPPNPTGYSPTMMVTCMNDPGTGATPDPLFNPAYSQFCYEIPFMPGATQYMDTPVTPTSAFAGAGYNNVDCAYPDATPAIKEVDGDPSPNAAGDAHGPWVSAAGHTLTITALGDQVSNNNAYSGPAAQARPYNQKTITRHYGFGATKGTVTIGVDEQGVPLMATVTSWSDLQIKVRVPGGVPVCATQQQALYGGSQARCGQLTITAANGKRSIDAITVTVGGKAPTHVTSTAPMTQNGPGAIQTAINNALPGDLIIVNPGIYDEMLLMWKPLRLQGVGAAASVINANTHPSGKLNPWRLQVNCLFGLAPNGVPPNNAGCGAGWSGFGNHPTGRNAADGIQVDRLPLEAVVGWDATLNGNLAELLQEPSLMGAFEGAGITVLAKGVTFPTGGAFLSDTFPADSQLLTTGNCTASNGTVNPYPSNFLCNPASIDGLSITDSSQGGGGIFVHAWAHNLEISNNRLYNNSGTLSGGINVGQGEFPPASIVGSVANASPGSCQNGGIPGDILPYCFNLNVDIHNNQVVLNSSIGDELFSSTPAGAGGVSVATGADNYRFTGNWVCGNLSTGDGGGFSHMGYSDNGLIEHNAFLFNQSTNPTVPTNGGGILVMGAPDTDPVCGLAPDGDCAPGTSDGTGKKLTINANLIMGNSAESGSGGGIRLQGVNGTDVGAFPRAPDPKSSGRNRSPGWNSVSITNNIIANNVAGWDGAGISLQDALKVNIVNNTIISNDTTASSGVLFNTLGAPISSSQGPTCTNNCGTTSNPQPAGVVAIQNSAPFTATLIASGPVTCPAGNPHCATLSYPLLYNDVIWQNRAFYIGVGSAGVGTLNQQNVVALYEAFNNAPAPSQPSADATAANGGGVIVTGGSGACVAPTGTANYWDIGVRGDTGPASHDSGITLAPTYSVLTSTAGYAAGLNDTSGNPDVVSQYCNGSRVPPEFMSMGYQVPPGISDATVPNPVFNLTPAATVDEGNNWVNMAWGPLSLVNPVSGVTLGNYALASGSSAIAYVPASAGGPGGAYTLAPSTDYFGVARKTNNAAVDAGAVKYVAQASAVANLSGGPLAFGNVVVGTTSPVQTLTLHNTGNAALTGINVVVTLPYAQAGGTCGATLAAGSNCTITVSFSPTASGATAGASATVSGSVAISGSPVTLTGTGVAAVSSATLTPTSWTVAQARNCPGTTRAGRIACALDPAQVFTLTNTGNTTLTGIAPSSVTATVPADADNYAIIGVVLGAQQSTCGTTVTTLAPNATCKVTVQFKPLTSLAAGLKAATLRVTAGAAGSLGAALNGTAN